MLQRADAAATDLLFYFISFFLFFFSMDFGVFIGCTVS